MQRPHLLFVAGQLAKPVLRLILKELAPRAPDFIDGEVDTTFIERVLLRG